MWTKKQFIELTGCTAATLIYYEQLGLVKPKREMNRYRVYTNVEYETIKMIKVLQYAQFSLEEIKMLVELSQQKRSTKCEENTQKLFVKKKKELLLMIQEYQKITEHINQYIEPDVVMSEDKSSNLIDEIYENIRKEANYED